VRRIKKKYWNIDTMNLWCNTEANGYSVLETKREKRSYQNVLLALIKCPDSEHDTYWFAWNNFKLGYRCFECKVGMKWTKEKVVKFLSELHTESTAFFGGKEGFEDRKRKDIIKNNYCIENKIPLLRIPYWEFKNNNYIKILNNFIKNN